MKAFKALVLGTALVACGCSGMQGTDFGLAAGAGLDLIKAATLSDEEVKQNSLAMMKHSDSVNPVLPPGNKYGARLARLTRKHAKEDGLNLNFKVYHVSDVNAFAAPDGSIRFFSGLMDLMTDQEILAIVGHEIGHVKLGHSKSQMQKAYAVSAARKGAASQSNVAGTLAASQLGGLLEGIMNAQFSQGDESDSDEYALQFMKKHKYDQRAVASALRKLAKLSEGGSSTVGQWFSSHPEPNARAERIEEMIASGNTKS